MAYGGRRLASIICRGLLALNNGSNTNNHFDIQGNCDGCYRKKINTITNFLNESSLKSAVTFSFNKASQKIYINTDASLTNKILKLLDKNGYTALSKQSLIADMTYDELKKKLD